MPHSFPNFEGMGIIGKGPVIDRETQWLTLFQSFYSKDIISGCPNSFKTMSTPYSLFHYWH